MAKKSNLVPKVANFERIINIFRERNKSIKTTSQKNKMILQELSKREINL